MAQLDLSTNYQNYYSMYKDVGAVRTTRFNKNIPYNESKEKNSQCAYSQSQLPKTSSNRNPIVHNQALSDCSYENIDSDSDNASNVLRWLRSLPSNFMINDLEKNMNYCKLREKTRNLHRCGVNRSKSLGPTLRSTGGIPLERKGIMLAKNKQKVDFVDGLNSTKVRSLNTKKKLINKKRHTNPSVSRLSNKCGKSDLSSNGKSQEGSMNNNKCQKIGILKNISQKSMESVSQRNTIENQIASNRRLLHSIKEIINTVDNDDPINQIEPAKKGNKRKMNEKTFSTFSDVKGEEKETKKPFLKNPAIEKKLDDAMRSTLKRYIHSNTWHDFQENNNNMTGEPPIKKEKRVIPSLAPVNSFHMDLGRNWNVNHVLDTLRPF